ncbi:MAG: exocyst complex component Sec10 [Amphiamblys sp. WSBS2006]|nr:MAG: exocyst complex component Sec10 [Amphiamblys sp. WSBS2006]
MGQNRELAMGLFVLSRAAEQDERERVEEQRRTFAKEMERRAARFFEEGNTEKMRGYGGILFAVGAGRECVDVVMRYHHSMQEELPDRIGISENTVDVLRKLPVHETVERKLQEIVSGLPLDTEYLQSVFSNSDEVMGMLVDRIVAGPVSALAGLFLDGGLEKGSLVFLKATEAVVERLRLFEEEIAAQAKHLKGKEICRDAIRKYLRTEKLDEEEKKAWGEFVDLVLAPTVLWKENKKKEKQKGGLFFARQEEEIVRTLSREIAGRSERYLFDGDPFYETDTEKELVSEDLLARAVEYTMAALRRWVLFGDESGQCGVVERGMGLLLKNCFETLVQREIDGMNRKTKEEPSHRSLSVAGRLGTFSGALQEEFEACFLTQPGAKVIAVKNRNMRRMEELLNDLVNYNTRSAVQWLERILSKQKRMFYTGKSTESETSETCRECCGYLQRVCSEGRKTLKGSNLARFVDEIGTNFVISLLDRLEGMPVSEDGVFVLASDMAEYSRVLSGLGESDVVARLSDGLGEIKNVYLVEKGAFEKVLEMEGLSCIPRRRLHRLGRITEEGLGEEEYRFGKEGYGF